MKCNTCQREITNLSNFTCPNFHCTLPGVTKHTSKSQEKRLEAQRCEIEENDLPDEDFEEIFVPDRKFGQK